MLERTEREVITIRKHAIMITVILLLSILALAYAKKPDNPPSKPQESLYEFWGFSGDSTVGPVDAGGTILPDKILVVRDNVNDDRFAQEKRRFHIYIGDHPQDSEHHSFVLPDGTIIENGYVKRLLRTNERGNVRWLLGIAEDRGLLNDDPIYYFEGFTRDGTVVTAFDAEQNAWHIEYRGAGSDFGPVSFSFSVKKIFP